MPKGNRGGQGAFSMSFVAQPQQQPQTTDDDDSSLDTTGRKTPAELWQEAKKNGVVDISEYNYTMDDLRNMSDQELHDIILASTKQDVPNYLMENNQQKFVVAFNGNDKPQVVDDKTFDQMAKGQMVIYNAQSATKLNGGYANGGVDLSDQEIQNYLAYGDYTLQQNGVYGNGIYFSNSRSGSAVYGTLQRRAILSPNAKVITMQQLQNKYNAWIKSHPQTRKAFGYVKKTNKGYGDNTYSQFALMQGYNVISAGNPSGSNNYFSVLDRSALIYSKSTRASGHGSW